MSEHAMQHVADLVTDQLRRVCPPPCGAEFDTPAITLDGRSLGLERYCVACRAKRAEAERQQHEQDRAAAERRKAEREAFDRQQAERERSTTIEHAWDALAIPPLYTDAALETFKVDWPQASENRFRQRQALQFARDYVADFPTVPGITLFAGKPGSGKGHLAWSIAKGVVAGGRRAEIISAGDMVRELRASWGIPGDRRSDLSLERFRRLDLLIIDEVSSHAMHGQLMQHLYEVMNPRLDQLRPTILTTNESDDGIRGLLSAALWDRIEGHGGVVDFGTESYRSRPR